jgi:hypothetical protein
MSRGRFRLAVLWVSIVAAGAAVGGALHLRRMRTRTAVVDGSAAVSALFADARGTDPIAPRPARGEPGWPPPIAVRRLDEVTAKRIWPSIGTAQYEFDSDLYLRLRRNLSIRRELAEHPQGGYARVSNSLGLRRSSEISPSRPDLRVIVTGASNVEGVCAIEETAAGWLERELASRLAADEVEVLNAGVGGYNFFNFLAVAGRFADMAPDALVVVAYGGTDFRQTAVLGRYFDRLGSPESFAGLAQPILASEDEFARELTGTELANAMYFARNPGDFEYAVGAAAWVTSEIERICRERGIALICAYLPPPLRGQPQFMAETRAEVLARVAMDESAYEVSDRLADAWLAFLEERSIPRVDLRPAFRASDVRFYWTTDTHINLAGQRALGEALLPALLEVARARGLSLRGAGGAPR